MKVFAFILGLAVFLWGTQYKLSLYYQSSDTHAKVPAAKLLCSENNSLAAVTSLKQQKVRPDPPTLRFSLLASTTASVTVPPARRIDQPGVHAAPARRASFPYFASLPPPRTAPFPYSI